MFGDTPLHIITEADQLAALCEKLSVRQFIGVDLEANSLHHFKERISLIQVSDSDADYIIDPILLDDISPLLALLSDKRICKIMHGSDYDIVSFKRDYGLHIHNLFDTLVAAKFLNYPQLGLAHLIKRHFGIEIDKAFQKHDWSKRPLLDEHLHYARGDTHWLLALHEIMSLKLKRLNRMEHVHEESQKLTLREWNDQQRHPSAFLRIKNARSLNVEEKIRLRNLWEYRNAIAEEMDRPVFKVIPDPVLIELSQKDPKSTQELTSVIRSKSKLYKAHGEEIISILEKARQDDRDLPKLPSKKRAKTGPYFDRIMLALRNWRADQIATGKLTANLALSNSQIKEISIAVPLTIEALKQTPLISLWQINEYGEDLLTIVKKTSQKQKKKRS